jgi:hypothetical protein
MQAEVWAEGEELIEVAVSVRAAGLAMEEESQQGSTEKEAAREEVLLLRVAVSQQEAPPIREVRLQPEEAWMPAVTETGEAVLRQVMKSMTAVLLLRGEAGMAGAREKPEAELIREVLLREEAQSPEKVVFLRHMFLEWHQKGARCI